MEEERPLAWVEHQMHQEQALEHPSLAHYAEASAEHLPSLARHILVVVLGPWEEEHLRTQVAVLPSALVVLPFGAARIRSWQVLHS